MTNLVDLDDEREERRGEQRRPVVRLDCLPGGVNAERPCPFVGCKHHLALTVKKDGRIDIGLHDMERAYALHDFERVAGLVAAMSKTCALDCAEGTPGMGEGGEMTLEEVGDVLGVTRERIRQIETGALAKLQQREGVKRLRGEIDRGVVRAAECGEDAGVGIAGFRAQIDKVGPKTPPEAPAIRHLQVSADGRRVGQVVGGRIKKRSAMPAAGSSPWLVRALAKQQEEGRRLRAVPVSEAWVKEPEAAPSAPAPRQAAVAERDRARELDGEQPPSSIVEAAPDNTVAVAPARSKATSATEAAGAAASAAERERALTVARAASSAASGPVPATPESSMPKSFPTLEDLDPTQRAMLEAYESGIAPMAIAAKHGTTSTRVNQLMFRLRQKGLVQRKAGTTSAPGSHAKARRGVTSKQKVILDGMKAGKRHAEIARESGLSRNSVGSAARQLRQKGMLSPIDPLTAPLRRRIEAINAELARHEELLAERERLEKALALLGGDGKAA